MMRWKLRARESLRGPEVMECLPDDGPTAITCLRVVTPDAGILPAVSC